MTWDLLRTTGPAADLHLRPIPDVPVRAVWWHEVTGPAVALGSSQPAEHLDAAAIEAAAVEVVRRRSGGGAVLLDPGDVLWMDLIVPAGDPLWDDDVVRSFEWVGRAWASALAACGVVDLHVHTGNLCTTRWSRIVCFSGLGAGEVTVNGRKVVGISQRRTRSAVRFQCAALGAWRPERLVSLLNPALGVDPADLADVAAPCGVDLATLADTFLSSLSA